MPDFYSKDELLHAGFTSVGNNVCVSNLCRLYGVSGTLGSNIRIDDFCILKGQLSIGSFVHVASYCLLAGTSDRITIHDFCSVAAHTTIYTGSDRFSSDHLHSSVVPARYKNVITGPVVVEKGALIGAQCVILPAVRIGPFASVGAMQVIYEDVPEGEVRTINGVRGKRSVQKMQELAEACEREARANS